MASKPSINDSEDKSLLSTDQHNYDSKKRKNKKTQNKTNSNGDLELVKSTTSTIKSRTIVKQSQVSVFFLLYFGALKH